ncbi:MAG: hypothetical protein PHQ17_06570 [Methanobacterium sp.]|nr:hypothetical protein [Methanobacterium sp.]
MEDYRKSVGELSIKENFEYCEITEKDYKMAIERIEELEKTQRRLCTSTKVNGRIINLQKCIRRT